MKKELWAPGTVPEASDEDDALAHPRDSHVWLHFFKLGVPGFPAQL